MKQKYDIFISYRRTSFDTANLIATKLSMAGYNVFIDIETLRSGKFNEKLFEVIEGCTDFIVVLPANALDRCVNEDDWVRQEVEHALKFNKNIIPIMLRGFEWPDASVLPPTMRELRNYNAITATDPNVFTENMERLKKNFLLSRPKSKYVKFAFISLVLIISVIVVLCVMMCEGDEQGKGDKTSDVVDNVVVTDTTSVDTVSVEDVTPTPAPEHEKEQTKKEVVYVAPKSESTVDAETQALYDKIGVDYAKLMFDDYIQNDYVQGSLDDAYEAWEEFVEDYSGDPADARIFIETIKMYKNTLPARNHVRILEADIVALRANGVDISDINGLNRNSDTHYDLVVTAMDYMIQCAEQQYPSMYNKYVKLYAEYTLKQLEYNYYTLLCTLSKMPDIIYTDIYIMAPAIEHFTMVRVNDETAEFRRMSDAVKYSVDEYARKLSGVKDIDDNSIKNQ